MKVRCIELKNWRGEPERRSSWLKIGSVYHVLGIQIEPNRTMIQLVGEEPTPALFQPELFEVVSSAIPSVWVIMAPKSGWLSLAPEAWNRPGFWEEFYDREPKAVACFEEYRKLIIESDS
jgi:hypothetical protein